MKKRTGFVSNSSSSSFILRKSVLSEDQINELRSFFKKYDNSYNTSVEESSDFFEGDVEAHNNFNDDESTASDLLVDLVDSFGLTLPRKKYFHIVYEDYAKLEDL
jgi:hypothetical protein